MYLRLIKLYEDLMVYACREEHLDEGVSQCIDFKFRNFGYVVPTKLCTMEG